RLEHRDALGADRQAVGGVFDVAAGDHLAVGRLQGGADQEVRERGVGVQPGRTGSVEQCGGGDGAGCGHGGLPPGQLSRMPAIAAFTNVAGKPTNSARPPSRARSWRRSGAIAPMPPSWMPTEAKLAKPVRAKAVSLYDRSDMKSGIAFHPF